MRLDGLVGFSNCNSPAHPHHPIRSEVHAPHLDLSHSPKIDLLQYIKMLLVARRMRIDGFSSL